MDELNDINPVEKRLVDKAGAGRIPISASFELTPVCNLKCDMCYVRMGADEVKRTGGLRSREQWLHTAEELRQAGTLFLLLTGGEPLLYPEFADLYVRLKQMGFILTINTNATLMTEEVIGLFQKCRPRRVNVTLYGSSNETYRELCHVSEGFDRCMRGLRLLKQGGIDTKINFTLLKKNYADYPRLLEIARELDMPVSVSSYLSVFRSQTCTSQLDIPQIRLDAGRVAEADIEYLKFKKGDGYSAYVEEMGGFLQCNVPTVSEGQGLTCRAGKSSCWINWQGVMTPCVDMDTPAASLDRMLVAEAWKMMTEERERLPLHTECAGCALRPVCDVCYANARNEKRRCGSLHYLCEMAAAKKELLIKESENLRERTKYETE